MSRTTVEQAIAALARGKFVLVTDDERRENEGDLILAAEKATPEMIAFMVRHTSGVICVPMTGERLDELGLPLMVLENTEAHRTAFTISVDYRPATTTGISAADRAATIRALADPASQTVDFARPGHVFPLRAREGGVLVRPGHTEASIDLTRAAGLIPAGVLCELVNDDGTMARGPAIARFGSEHRIPLITVADVVAHRWRTEALVTREAEATVPTEWGEFIAVGYRSTFDGSEHVAFVRGEVAGKPDVLTRVHSECLTGDVFSSRRCDCGDQLREAMRRVAAAGEGVVVYDRRHEGRGIGLVDKLRAYRLQDEGLDTVEANLSLGHPADARHYGVDAQILQDLKVESVRLMTNNPDKIRQLVALGVTVASREALETAASPHNELYLATKARKLGHFLRERIEEP